MANVVSVVNFNGRTERIEPQTWDSFLYDNDTNGGIIAAIDTLFDQIRTIESDISELETAYNTLIGLYDVCPFEEALKSNIRSLNGTKEVLIKFSNQLVTNIQSQLQQAVDKDNTLSTDLELLQTLADNSDLAEVQENHSTTGVVWN